jgi:hypothetical protein
MPRDSRALRERLRWPFPIALLVFAAAALPVGFAVPITTFQVLGMASGIFGIVLIGDALGLTQPILRPPDPAEVRVKKLIGALTESTKVIAEIEKEVKARGSLVERLQGDIERHRELLKLNQAEVEAVAQTFRAEVRTEGRRTLLANVLMSAFFFGLGVLVTVLLS